MKAFFVTLLILGAAFLALDYTGSLGQRIVFKSLDKTAPRSPEPVTAETKPEEKPDPGEKPKPVVVASNTAPAAAPSASPVPVVTASKPDSPAFVEPKYETLEVLSKGWTTIPKSAFPRRVKLTKNIQFKMSAGVATLNGGANVMALGFAGGQLILAPSEASLVRASAPVDNTNLKEVLEAGYVEWKKTRTELARRTFLATKARGEAPSPTPVDPNAVDAAGKPLRGNDGAFPVLVASLNSGDVTELKLANIHHWDDPVATTLEGRPAWSIKVQADVETVFGLQPAEAQALVRDGRVKGWFYTGSGEPVP